jgi:hypothetical protein
VRFIHTHNLLGLMLGFGLLQKQPVTWVWVSKPSRIPYWRSDKTGVRLFRGPDIILPND